MDTPGSKIAPRLEQSISSLELELFYGQLTWLLLFYENLEFKKVLFDLIL
jgi:hypothetical protein